MHIWYRGRTVSEKCPDHQSWLPNGGWERLERKDKGSQEGHSGQVGRMFVSNRHQVQQGSEETTEGGYRGFWEECERTYEWGPPGMNADVVLNFDFWWLLSGEDDWQDILHFWCSLYLWLRVACLEAARLLSSLLLHHYVHPSAVEVHHLLQGQVPAVHAW